MLPLTMGAVKENLWRKNPHIPKLELFHFSDALMFLEGLLRDAVEG